MSDLVERVARALLRADHEHADGPTADWDEADPTERIYFLAGAEAAIAAVHEFRNIYGIAALEAAAERVARGEGAGR